MTVPSDYYALFDLPLQLSLSPAPLQKRFYELSRQWHPDRFARKSPPEQQHALDMSSMLNDAYRTLRDPVKRAEYVLKQQGLDLSEQRSNNVPPELLEEVFELNMALEEMRGGDSSARPQLERASEDFAGMLTGVDAQLDVSFARYDAHPSPEVLAEIRGILNRRKYIQNLVSEVSVALAA